jgi:hypothetical protein
MLQPEAGYAAVGRPQEVVSIVLVEVAVVMLDGTSARYVNSKTRQPNEGKGGASKKRTLQNQT